MSLNVLVADDSATIRKIIIRSLNSVGVQNIVEAADEQAVAAFKPRAFDCRILTNWKRYAGRSRGLDVVRDARPDTSVRIMMVTTEAEDEIASCRLSRLASQIT